MQAATKKRVFIGVGVFVAIILLIGFFAPPMTVEREIIINKPQAQVFSYLTHLKNQEQWSPWLKMDPEAKVGYKGGDARVGAISTWDGNDDVGAGEQEIKSIKKNERVDIELRFSRPMEGTSQAWFVTEPVEGEKNQTRVKWGFTSEETTFFCNIMSTVMRPYMNHIFDSGLEDLKAALEK